MTLVVGYGNPLRSDDGIGWYAAQALAQELEGTGHTVLATHQLTPEIAEPLSRADRVVFIDAAAGPTPGRIRSQRIAPSRDPFTGMTHHLNPAVLLAGAQILFGRAPKAVIVTVCGENFEHGEAFSSAVSEAFPRLMKKLRRLIGTTAPAGKETIHA